MQAKMKMKAQANKLVLSYLWWVLEPLLFVSLFYFVFEFLLQRGGENYLLFLVVGKIVYLWFSKSIVTASNGIVHNRGIIGQRSIPKWIFPLVNIQETLYKSLISFSLLFGMLWLMGHEPWFGYWQLIPLMIITYVLICAIGMFCAILVTFARDFSNLINLGMMGLMFGSGVFWDINNIQDPEIRQIIFELNPLAAILDGFRKILISQSSIDLFSYIPAFIFSVIVLGVSLWVIRRYNNKLTRVLFS